MGLFRLNRFKSIMSDLSFTLIVCNISFTIFIVLGGYFSDWQKSADVSVTLANHSLHRSRKYLQYS
jgi:hypothetical protein